jgi:ABC-type polar amino acid transport system ATPase subunit
VVDHRELEVPLVDTGSAISARAVCKSFGDTQVLRDVDLDIHKGGVVSIVGPSGGGKSTFLRCLNLLELPDSGEVYVQNECVYRTDKKPSANELRALRCKVGMVFQDLHTFPHLTAFENVVLPMTAVLHMDERAAMDRAAELLASVGMTHRAAALPTKLSGGQKQRVAIARALALAPDVLLFDEPTSALDPESVAEVLEVIQALAEKGTTMVLVSHELAFVENISTKVVFMERGSITAAGTVEDVIYNPESERVRTFMATHTSKDGKRLV